MVGLTTQVDDKENILPTRSKAVDTPLVTNHSESADRDRTKLVHESFTLQSFESVFDYDAEKIQHLDSQTKTLRHIELMQDDLKRVIISPTKTLKAWMALTKYIQQHLAPEYARLVFKNIVNDKHLCSMKDLYKQWLGFEMNIKASDEARDVVNLAIQHGAITNEEKQAYLSQIIALSSDLDEKTIAFNSDKGSNVSHPSSSHEPTISFNRRGSRSRGGRLQIGGLSKFGPAKRLAKEADETDNVTEESAGALRSDKTATKTGMDLNEILQWKPDPRRMSEHSESSSSANESTVAFDAQAPTMTLQTGMQLAKHPTKHNQEPTISFQEVSEKQRAVRGTQPLLVKAPGPTREELAVRISNFQNSFFSSKNIFIVNGKLYLRLALIGRGGTSKVYKVLALDDQEEGQTYALKKIKLQSTDSHAMASYYNEIALLERLRGNGNIISLIDSEVNLNQKVMYMVMEHGEIDLNSKLQMQRTGSSTLEDQVSVAPSGLTYNFIRLTWMNMLEALHSIHEERIVHGDLKPANFLFVKGKLKLIDFGIAKAISNDTTNIMRDSQVGTLNYMSPESINDTNHVSGAKPKIGVAGMKFKQGRTSDIWSMGCILYQMIYGKTPFSDLNPWKKIQCISNPDYKIDYPPLTGVSHDILDVVQSCLQFNPSSRPPISSSLSQKGLLSHPFLNPGSSTGNSSATTSIPTQAWAEEMSGEEHIEAILEEVYDDPRGLEFTLAHLETKNPEKLRILHSMLTKTITKAREDHKPAPKITSTALQPHHASLVPSLQESIRSGRNGLKSLETSTSSKFMRHAKPESSSHGIAATIRQELDKRRPLLESQENTLNAMVAGNTWDFTKDNFLS